jgi:hypothetical protein
MSDVDKEFEQLKLLFDYTKFHIGLYASIATIFGTLIAADKTHLEFKFNSGCLFASIVFVCVAGLAGGMIASSIPGYSNYSKFMEEPLAPYDIQKVAFKARYWTYIEHTSFWIAVVLAILSISPLTSPPLPL